MVTFYGLIGLHSERKNKIVCNNNVVIVGHNWGSNHDFSDSCVPSGSEGGKYLMYQFTVSGLDYNNKVSYAHFMWLCGFYASM